LKVFTKRKVYKLLIQINLNKMIMAIQKYLEKPLELLRQAGILEKAPESQLVVLLDGVQDVDQPRILAIASAVRYIDQFSDFVNDHAQGMNVSDRYNDITGRFKSVREDAKELLKHSEDNKITRWEKIEEWWMRLRRGSIPHRIKEIGSLFQDVCRDVRGQINREAEVLEAYKDFRTAIKEAEVLAYEVARLQGDNVGRAQAALKNAAGDLEAYTGEDAAQRAKLELARDNAIRAAKTEQAKYKLLEDVAQNLKAGYEVGEVLVQKIEQTHDAKKAIFTKAVAFFGTNKQVLSAMGFAYVAEQGVHEMTEVTERMGKEMSQSLEDLAALGQVDLEATRVAHASVYNPDSVRKLVDAINKYEEDVAKVVVETRKKAAEDITKIAEIVEDGKKKRVAIVTDYLSGKVPVA
jgi:ribosomal protein L17